MNAVLLLDTPSSNIYSTVSSDALQHAPSADGDSLNSSIIKLTAWMKQPECDSVESKGGLLQKHLQVQKHSITNCDPQTHLSTEPVSPEHHCQSHGAVSITHVPLHRCSFMSCLSQPEGSSAESYIWLPVGIFVVEKWPKCCTLIYSGCVGQN